MSDDTDTRDLSDEQLLCHCRWEAFRASGPGGQKRNKTSSAIRITHVPTGIAAIANESRSQSHNRAKALQRLRHRLVLELRRPVDIEKFTVPGWFADLLQDTGRLNLGTRSQPYLPALGLVLDVLTARGASVSDAAGLLGLTTANLVHFLQADPKAWAHVNQMRLARGLKPLRG